MKHQRPHGKNVVRSGEIKALTGLRIVAAVWVVLFHFRPLLRDAAPGFLDALTPVLNCGAQGVDLFFILSGFVLTWNYLDRMGGSWSTRATLHFLWLRLARVWPVYLVTLHLAALWVIFTLHVGHVPSQEIYRFTAISYVRQVLLVQLWFQPFFDDSSWDGPAWSISAEWLAYILFGLLVLVIFRMARATRARNLIWLAVAAALPPVVSLLVTGQFYTPWSWLPRIVMQFTAGALVAAAVSRLQLTDRGRRAAGWASVLLMAGVVGFLYWSDAHPLHGVIGHRRTGRHLVRAAGDDTGNRHRQLAGAAVHPADGLRRADLVLPVHGSRAGAHRVDLDGPAVRAHDGRQRRQAAAGRSARGDLRRRGRAVPRRRGARPSLDAQDGRRWPACGRRR